MWPTVAGLWEGKTQSVAAVFNPLFVCFALLKQDLWPFLVVVACQIGRLWVFKKETLAK